MPVEYNTINQEEIDFKNNNKYIINNYSLLMVPLYAQIPAKTLNEYCLYNFNKEFTKDFEKNKFKNNNNINEDNRTFKLNNKLNKQFVDRKKIKKIRKHSTLCSSTISYISPPRLINKQTDQTINSAIRRGNRWFMSEYGNSYTLLQYDNISENINNNNYLNSQLSFPSFIHTISVPFYGTDNTIGGISGNEIFFYQIYSLFSKEEGVLIQAFNLNTGQKIKKLIYAENIPLYGTKLSKTTNLLKSKDYLNKKENIYSSIDFEFDQLLPSSSFKNSNNSSKILWVLYRPFSSKFLKNSSLSVLKLSPDNLEELGHWELENIDPTKIINCFIAKGVLYKIIIDNNNKINKNEEKNLKVFIIPIFDFNKDKALLNLKPLKFKRGNWTINKLNGRIMITNVQYDMLTDSISVTENGKIYVLELFRN